jgi:agmatinase
MIPLPELPEDPPLPMEERDPGAPDDGSGSLFGLRTPAERASLVAVPVPYEATVTAGLGTAGGPAALIAASPDIDLLDPIAGEPWREGLCALPESPALAALSRRAARARARLRGGDGAAAAEIDAAAAAVAEWLETVTDSLMATGRVPAILGGEHSVSLGALRAAVRRHPGLGILQIDAHADLRESYEGLRSSHASVMARALELEGVAQLVQVGLRDVSPAERHVAEREAARVRWLTDAAIGERLHAGESFQSIVQALAPHLPEALWISFDVDGLDPSLCPGTGTPVPGGLSWREATTLLAHLVPGRRLVGFDIVEIGPRRWDGLVGAKLLYLLAGLALRTGPSR